MMFALTTTATRTLLRKSTFVGRQCLSTQCNEAVGRLRNALEQYRVENYQQEIPSRFKKDMVIQCSRGLTTTNATNNNRTMAVEGIEELLQNIGVFGKEVTHDDVIQIVTEYGEESKDTTLRADTILSKIL